MFDDLDGTRQQWRVPIYSDLEQDAHRLTDQITATNDRLRVAHALALTREFAPPPPSLEATP